MLLDHFFVLNFNLRNNNSEVVTARNVDNSTLIAEECHLLGCGSFLVVAVAHTAPHTVTPSINTAQTIETHAVGLSSCHINNEFIFEHHERRAVLQVVVEFRLLMFTFAPCVNRSRLHRKSTHELAAANRNNLVTIEYILNLVWSVLIRCLLVFFDEAET